MIRIKLKKLREQKRVREPELNPTQQHNLKILTNNSYTAGHASHRGIHTNIADNFIEDLGNQKYENTRDEDAFEKAHELNVLELMTKIVRGVPSLRTSRIRTAITGDSYGKIFKLENEHILKIFLGGVDVESDMQWYKKCYDMLHSGSAKKTTLPVYGEPGKLEIDGYNIWYVEMAEVIPLDKFIKGTAPHRAGKVSVTPDVRETDPDGIISQVKALYKMAKEQGASSADEIKKIVLSFAQDDKSLEPLTRNEVSSIIHTFFDLNKMGFKLSDVASRNMGVLRQDPDTVVIFDR